MKILRRLFFVLATLVILLLVGGFLLPSEYQVERSIVIQAPQDLVFAQVNDLKKNEAWTPWKDPTMKITYSENTEGVGASSSWESKDMGNGSQTITASAPPAAIDTHLDFGDMGQADVHWSFAAEGKGVQVTQTMKGDQGMNPMKRYFGLIMDKMLGPKFEEGLASLKSVSEALDAEMKAEEARLDAAAADSSAAE
jgi:hypothetical protein